jgi:hypothetical protein
MFNVVEERNVLFVCLYWDDGLLRTERNLIVVMAWIERAMNRFDIRLCAALVCVYRRAGG